MRNDTFKILQDLPKGDNTYRSAPDEYKQHLKEHGFDLLEHKINDKDCNDHKVCLARYKKS